MMVLASIAKSIWRVITFPLTLIGLVSDLVKLGVIVILILIAISVWQIWFT